jgi:isopentenyl diphosphate isomerase/L-lactate dehydrogenase-like FMN-dependent dehydrogenase
MEYTKEDLRKVFDEVIKQAENKGYIDVTDVRRLTQHGIPIIEISRGKGMFDWLRHRFEQWLNNL